MHSGAKVLIGAAAVGLLAYVCHGPLGMGRGFMEAVAGNAKSALAAAGGANVAVAFQQEPLARLAVLSGPITDKAEQAKYIAAVRGAFGVHDARWSTAPAGLATLPPAAAPAPGPAASPTPASTAPPPPSAVAAASPAPATPTPDLRSPASEAKPEGAAKPVAAAGSPAASASDGASKGAAVARCQSALDAAAAGKTIGFATGQARLSTTGRALVGALAVQLKTCSGVKIEVGGHTDAVGKKKANQRLSEARARRVVHALIAKGVPRSLLSAKGYGASTPVAPGDDAASRAKNRRIAFTIMSAG